MKMCFCFQTTVVFSKTLDTDCGTAAPTVSATGNQRQHQGLVAFRVRAEEVTALLRIHLQQVTYLRVVLGGAWGKARGKSLFSSVGILAIAGHQ